MTAPQTLPEAYPVDDLRRRDERARWLAVYGAAFAQLAIAHNRQHGDGPHEAECIYMCEEAECIADLEASARAAWEAEQVRRLDADEGAE